MLKTLVSQLQPHLNANSPVYVAYSGGLDSTVLLHLTKQAIDLIGYGRLYAIHVNHNLSQNALVWQRHCEQVCLDWHIGFIAQSVHIESHKEGIEAKARKLRYQAIERSIEAGAIVLSGQHQDDQVETLLLQLKRGAGPKGLSAMGQAMDFAQEALLLRPLLGHTRAELEQYARAQQLCWVEDESNDDLRFDRNFIRHQITPALNQRWPGFGQAVCRSVALIAEQQQLVDELAAGDLACAQLSRHIIDIDKLKALSVPRQKNLLRFWFDGLRLIMPSKVLLERILSEVIGAKPDADPVVRWAGLDKYTSLDKPIDVEQSGDVEVRRYRDQLYLLSAFETQKGQDCELTLNQPMILNDGIGRVLLTDELNSGAVPVPAPEPQDKITLRFGVEGLKIKPKGAKQHKKLNNLFKELGVPPWQRLRTPLLFYGQTLIAVGDLAVTCDEDKNGAKAYFGLAPSEDLAF